MVGRHLFASSIAALISPLLLAATLSVLEGVHWENPVGLIVYAGIFVFPFTLLGCFAVVWPAHQLLLRGHLNRLIIRLLVAAIAAIAGAAMLGLVSGQEEGAAIGALSGIATAAVWLIAFAAAGRWRSVDSQGSQEYQSG